MKLIEIPNGTANRLLERVMAEGTTNEAICDALSEAYEQGYQRGWNDRGERDSLVREKNGVAGP